LLLGFCRYQRSLFLCCLICRRLIGNGLVRGSLIRYRLLLRGKIG
jgi:hypothetical protein